MCDINLGCDNETHPSKYPGHVYDPKSAFLGFLNKTHPWSTYIDLGPLFSFILAILTCISILKRHDLKFLNLEEHGYSYKQLDLQTVIFWLIQFLLQMKTGPSTPRLEKYVYLFRLETKLLAYSWEVSTNMSVQRIRFNV